MLDDEKRSSWRLKYQREEDMTFVARSMLCLGLLIAGPACAHHSITGQFDITKQLKLVGQVSKVDWVNPHIFIYLDVKDETGAVKTWKLEAVPVVMARKAGVTKERLLAPNQVLTMTCYPARDGTPGLGIIFRIDYPDGTFVQMAPMMRG
jgi:hypothetical protein